MPARLPAVGPTPFECGVTMDQNWANRRMRLVAVLPCIGPACNAAVCSLQKARRGKPLKRRTQP